MTRLGVNSRSACIFVCALTFSARIWCDDSAAAIGAGGLVARRETRVVMAKEVLKIGPSRVQVDYDFRNDTGQDVTLPEKTIGTVVSVPPSCSAFMSRNGEPVGLVTVDASEQGIDQLIWIMRPSKLSAISTAR